MTFLLPLLLPGAPHRDTIARAIRERQARCSVGLLSPEETAGEASALLYAAGRVLAQAEGLRLPWRAVRVEIEAGRDVAQSYLKQGIPESSLLVVEVRRDGASAVRVRRGPARRSDRSACWVELAVELAPGKNPPAEVLGYRDLGVAWYQREEAILCRWDAAAQRYTCSQRGAPCADVMHRQLTAVGRFDVQPLEDLAKLVRRVRRVRANRGEGGEGVTANARDYRAWLRAAWALSKPRGLSGGEQLRGKVSLAEQAPSAEEGGAR